MLILLFLKICIAIYKQFYYINFLYISTGQKGKMNVHKRLSDHRSFLLREKEKKKEKEALIAYLNLQQKNTFGTVLDPVRKEELE